MTPLAPSTRGWIGPYLLLAVLWGCSFLFIATALQTFAPTTDTRRTPTTGRLTSTNMPKSPRTTAKFASVRAAISA